MSRISSMKNTKEPCTRCGANTKIMYGAFDEDDKIIQGPICEDCFWNIPLELRNQNKREQKHQHLFEWL